MSGEFGITYRRTADFDVDANFALIGAREEDTFEPLRYDLFKRITTPGLPYDFTDKAADWIDVREFVGTGLSTDTIAARVDAAIEADDRVDRATTTIAETVTGEERELTISVRVETAEGPFDLIVSATRSLALLEASNGAG